MNIDELTVKEIKQIASLANGLCGSKETTTGLNSMIGEKVIIRTYSAGVHFGTLLEKSGTEVILGNSRRLWYWKAKKSISLSAVAVHGVTSESKITPAVDKQWLDAIEIIPCTDEAIETIEGQPDVAAS